MKRHPLDWFSLLAGLFVTAVAAAAFVGPWRVEVGPWAWPTMLVLAGLVIIALVLTGSRRGPSDGGPTAAPPADDDPERDQALAAAYAELDDDMSLAVDPVHDGEPDVRAAPPEEG